MALIECPECGGKVSDKAPACIHCGYPLQEPKEEQVQQIQYCPYCGKQNIIEYILWLLWKILCQEGRKK